MRRLKSAKTLEFKYIFVFDPSKKQPNSHKWEFRKTCAPSVTTVAFLVWGTTAHLSQATWVQYTLCTFTRISMSAICVLPQVEWDTEELSAFLFATSFVVIIATSSMWVCVWRLKRILELFALFFFVLSYLRCLHNTHNELRKIFRRRRRWRRRRRMNAQTRTHNDFYGLVEPGWQPAASPQNNLIFNYNLWGRYIFATQQ